MIKKNIRSRAKSVVIASAIATATTFTTCSALETHVDNINRQKMEMEQANIERMKPLLRKAEEKAKFDREVEKKIKENQRIAKRLREEEEKKKQELNAQIEQLKNKTGLNIIGFQEYTFELSFYSDLNCENGFGNLTANGETLSDGMIANNFLDFNTNVYFEGYGTKRVTDRGSEKYFNAINKADVFVPRNGDENDDEYYARVNNMGRKYVKGYILEIGD